jgi:hypothetical protein
MHIPEFLEYMDVGGCKQKWLLLFAAFRLIVYQSGGKGFSSLCGFRLSKLSCAIGAPYKMNLDKTP